MTCVRYAQPTTTTMTTTTTTTTTSFGHWPVADDRHLGGDGKEEEGRGLVVDDGRSSQQTMDATEFQSYAEPLW